MVAEIETDKTAIPVPAPKHGIIEELLVADGATVKAGQEIFKLKVTDQPPAGAAAAPAKKAEPAAAPPPSGPPPAAAAKPPPPPPAQKPSPAAGTSSMQIKI